MSARPATLRVDVWSDIACPWCWVGKRRLEAALADFEHKGAVRLVWRAFELDPSAPKERPSDVGYVERLAKKYGTPVAQAQAMIDRMVTVGAADGLEFRFDRIRAGNTFDAHRLLHQALEMDATGKLQDALKERLFRGYFTEGACMTDRDALVRLAGEVGIDADQASAVLATDMHAADVRADQAEAREHGVSGVPFFAFAGKYGVSGAQPSEALLRVLEKSYSEISGPAPAFAEGAACGPDGCA